MYKARILVPVLFGLLITLGLLTGLAQVSGVASAPQAPTATIVYVDVDATGAATGLDWANAYPNLQDALTVAISGTEIWVAEGIYYPDEGNGKINDDRRSTFTLTMDIDLYGGFDPGSGADEFAERDWETYITVLSGDIDHETNPDITDPYGVVTDTENVNGNNAFHVVSTRGVNAMAVIDGFSITAGWANGNDTPNDYGGGIYNDQSSPTLMNIVFSGNWAVMGGGISNRNNSNPNLSNVNFYWNRAGWGGGMYNKRNSSPALFNVIFSGNSAVYSGGGMNSYDGSNATLLNVIFLENSSHIFGGGMNSQSNSNPTLTNVIFSGNSSYQGGGLFTDSNPLLMNVTFSNNIALGGKHSTSDGGIYSYTSGSTLPNLLGGNGGGMYIAGRESPTLFNVTFSDNWARRSGGGLYNESYGGSPRLLNVTFSGNSSENGGGMYNWGNSSPILLSVIFSGNSAVSGGGIRIEGGNNTILTNVTFSGNSATTGGGIYTSWDSHPMMNNMILWKNVASGSGSQIYNDGGTPIISNSNIQGSGGSGVGWDTSLGSDGGGNIDADPLFVRNPDPGNDDYGDLHLQPGSPAIDSGTNTGCPATDRDGLPRPIGAACDMGAYEFALIYKSVDNPFPISGQTITFTIVIANQIEAFTGGLISDTLSSGLNFLGPITLEPADAGLVGTAPPILASNLTISYTENVTLTFPVTVSLGLEPGTQLVNTATFSSTELIAPLWDSTTLIIAYRTYLPLVGR